MVPKRDSMCQRIRGRFRFRFRFTVNWEDDPKEDPTTHYEFRMETQAL